MKQLLSSFRILKLIRICSRILFIAASASFLICCQQQSPHVPQMLDYIENPVDVPNPDRGFYRPESYVIPVDGGTPSFPDLRDTITGTSVSVDTRIVYMEFDLRNFSSNAPLNGKPLGVWSDAGSQKPDYGTTQPLTPAAPKLCKGRASASKGKRSCCHC